MFNSTSIDKFRRSVKKYRDGEISDKKMVQAIRRPVFICIALMLIVLGFCIYIIFFMNKHNKFKYDDDSAMIMIYHQDRKEAKKSIQQLYDKFYAQFLLMKENPSITLQDKLLIPQNKLFTRTKTVQYMFDFIEAKTRDLYYDEYIKGGANYHKVKCVETFTPRLKHRLPEFTIAVEQYIENNRIYSQDSVSSLVARERITAENNGGLKLDGQFGVVAQQFIAQNTAIGHYYGDEYFLEEYEEQYPWDEYGELDDHPYRLKWDYYMTIPYHLFSEKKINLPHANLTFTMDSYHQYNYQQYVDLGGQDLTEHQSKLKQNVEVYINDARGQLYKPNLSSYDLRRKNTEFIYCSVDGIIMTFVMATKDLKPNDQLFVYYGPNYG